MAQAQMKLGDYISQTISEIIDGVIGAQEYAKDKGAYINPKNVNWSDTKQAYYVVGHAPAGKDSNPMVSELEFDVLLTLGEDKGIEGGIGIFATGLSLGYKADKKDHTATVNRLKFQILALLPQQK